MDHISYIAYKVFVEEKRYSIEDVANKIGVHPSTIYRMWEDRNHSHSVKRLQSLYFATGDKIWLEAMLHGTGYDPIQRFYPENITPKSIQEELLDNHESLSAIHSFLKSALQDGKLDSQEIEKLMRLAKVNLIQATEIYELLKAMKK